MVIQNKHNKDVVKQTDQRQVEYKKKFLGSMKVIPGLTVFEMDITTGKISKSKFDTLKIADKQNSGPSSRQLTIDNKKMYTQALNLKNAKRKFTKRAKEIIQQSK